MKLVAPGSRSSVKAPSNAEALIVVIKESNAASIVKSEPPDMLRVEVSTPST